MPAVYLKRLDTLWFQVAGTHCNLQCSHCFISCGPKNNNHCLLKEDVIQHYLKEASAYGVKEFYFTGGEPFLHPDILNILKESLSYGIVTVLTNGTLITSKVAQLLAQISNISKNKLEFRVSLESYLEEENDRIRGKNSFKNAIRGIQALVDAGFYPIITYTDQYKYKSFTNKMEKGFKSLTGALNIPQLRVKKLPLILLGRCAELIRPYYENERITDKCFDNYSMDNLQCSTSRMITSKGVFVCPLLINDSNAWMGWTLKEAFRPYTMESPVCYTCRMSGLTCKNDNEQKIVPNNIVRKSVHEFYATAANKPQKELCCPTGYNNVDLSHIPQQILDISYGCGSPVTMANIKPGENVLDLGSGGGVDCFIASKWVGEKGYVIGIDMTDEMLNKANTSRKTVARNLGFDNVRFMKGFLEEIPLADEKIDLVTSNCVINLSLQKEKVLREIFRVLKTGGRFVISDIVSNRNVPSIMRQNKKLWSECISGAIKESEFFNIIKTVGFYGLEVIHRNLYRETEGIKFYSMTLKAYKFKKSRECLYTGQYAIYKGPFNSVSDDDGHTYPMGVPIEICTDTAWKLSNPPYKGIFIIYDMQTKDVKTICEPACCQP